MAEKNKSGSVDLTKAYQQASEKLIASLNGNSVQGVKIAFEKTLQTVVTQLDKLNANEIARAVRQGQDATRGKFLETLSTIFNGRAFTVKDLADKGLDINNQRIAEKILNKQSADIAKNAVYRQSFLELRGQLVGVSKDLQRTVNAELHNLAKSGGNTVATATRNLAERLKSQGIMNVKYSNGASVGVDKYATMVARSARTESANAENMKLSSVFGTDLVECVGNAVTCDVCAQFRGRVFSISGNDKRYPPLRDGANSPLKNGYDLIHPNCRCEFRSYFEALHSDKDNDSKQKFSNRSFNGDKRTMAQAKAYQNWQIVQRRAITEQSRFNEMRSVLGSDMQYADIGALRRALRSDKDSFSYKKSHYAVRDYKQYERWKTT
ncbi:MAG: phage minor capsid protein, partial [Clostridia bacterium]